MRESKKKKKKILAGNPRSSEDYDAVPFGIVWIYEQKSWMFGEGDDEKSSFHSSKNSIRNGKLNF